MRALLLIVLTISIIIGLPRLADRFRDAPPRRDLRSTELPSPDFAKPGLDDRSSSSQNTGIIESANAAPVALQAIPPIAPKRNDGQYAPLGEAELIAAIQSELFRIGYYAGPPAKTWSRPLRLAARRYSENGGRSIDYRVPSLKLLNSLRSAPAASKEPFRHATPHKTGNLDILAAPVDERPAASKPHRREKNRAAKHKRHRLAHHRPRRPAWEWDRDRYSYN